MTILISVPRKRIKRVKKAPLLIDYMLQLHKIYFFFSLVYKTGMGYILNGILLDQHNINYNLGVLPK